MFKIFAEKTWNFDKNRDVYLKRSKRPTAENLSWVYAPYGRQCKTSRQQGNLLPDRNT